MKFSWAEINLMPCFRAVLKPSAMPPEEHFSFRDVFY